MVSIKTVKTGGGLQTIESMQKKLGISWSTAIKYIHLVEKIKSGKHIKITKFRK